MVARNNSYYLWSADTWYGRGRNVYLVYRQGIWEVSQETILIYFGWAAGGLGDVGGTRTPRVDSVRFYLSCLHLL